MIKSSTHAIKGMQRDLTVSKFNPEFAFDTQNIRITARDNNTLLSITNEKGNKEIILKDSNGSVVTLQGTVIGYNVLNNYLTLFTTDNTTDRIYRLERKGDYFECVTLYTGSLGFSTLNPIENIGVYENENIQKVYWIDGKNQPRVINIVAPDDVKLGWLNTSFDFVQTLELQETISVSRNTVAGGVFAPGVIQYAFTYFNKYGQESNIFYTSPLYYISYNNRGASPEDKVSNSFNIEVVNVDRRFDYIRIYSIHRTSINATPDVRRVVDLAPPTGRSNYKLSSYEINLPANKMTMYRIGSGAEKTLDQYEPSYSGPNYKSWTFDTNEYYSINFGGDYLTWGTGTSFIITITNSNKASMQLANSGNMTGTLSIAKVTYTDNGSSGDSVDPTELLYIGGEEAVFGTMAQKDNTLFLGDIKIKRKTLDSTIRSYFKGKSITFSTYNKSISPPEAKGYYPYSNQLKMNSYQFKTFKYLEYYRFGIQAQHYTGKWSEPIWINDVRNTVHIDTTFYEDNKIGLPVAEFTLNDSNIISRFLDNGYIRIRPVIVYPTINDREVICQGILCPTVYNVSDRFGNSPFAQSSWFIRPNAPFDIYRATHIKGQDVTFMLDLYNISGEPSKLSIDGTDIIFSISNIITSGGSGNSVRGIRIYGDDNLPQEGSITFYDGGSGTSNYTSYITEQETPWSGDWNPIMSIAQSTSPYSRAGITANDNVLVDGTTYIDIINKGTWAEFRHNYPIPGNNNRNAEIQCIWNPPATPYISSTTSDTEINNWVSKYAENYYIDQSIITLHSPDIEFDDNIKSLDTSGLKLRIVGIVPLTAFASDIDIQTSTPVNNFFESSDMPLGFYKEPIGVENDFSYSGMGVEHSGDSHFGYKGLISGPFWFDDFTGYKDRTNPNKLTTAFVVYPWHRNGSLNNTKFATDGYRSAMLDRKKLSNIRYSYKSVYYDTPNIWYAYYEDNMYRTGISGVSIFDSNEVSLIRLPAPKNSKLSDINYYGNVDKLLTVTRIGDKKEGYPIMTSGILNVDDNTNAHKLFSAKYIQITSDYTDQVTGLEPVRIRYKSTPHAVIALNYTTDGRQKILPTIKDGDAGSEPWYVNGTSIEEATPYWNLKNSGVAQDTISIMEGPASPESIQHGWLWLGELYNDNIENRFGGQTEEAFENNIWLPCGDPVSLVDSIDGVKKSVTIKWEEGDTYYQRYDHIKTYPFTTEDQNQVTDIVSFMCETRVNIDGRYDRNRGQTSNFAITPENFNLINDVYSQKNNFFTYRALNYSKYSLDYFPNTITWTKEKQAGATVDTWTNITMASILDLDGDKGEIVSLNTFNNEIYCFQRQGFSNILFNSRVQIPTSDGMPIEITNGLKVDGKRYISNSIGCNNKWSIAETPSGLYFIDNITNSIYLFNGQIGSLSDKLGFRQWVSENNSLDKWTPLEFRNFITYYDKNNNDVYFVNNETALVYSELLGQFTSFMSYGQVPAMFNINNDFYAIQYGKIWEQFAGDYNMFFGYYYPYSVTFISNADEPYDKIFNTIEFRADCWTKNEYGNDVLVSNNTFDTLEVWNEYQKGVSTLTKLAAKPSPLKKKFRVWRANVPRFNTDWNGVKANNRDRIRNTWAYVKLSMNKENTDRMEFHDMIVHYFV